MVCYPKSCFLVKMLADYLESDRHIARSAQSARNGYAGQASQVNRYRVDVFQIQRQRVGNLLPYFECRGRRYRADDGIDFFESIVEVLSQQGADLLGFQVISVVVSRRQRICSQDY